MHVCCQQYINNSFNLCIVIVIVIVIVIFKQGVRSAQADFQRSPVYITHTTNSNTYTYKLAIHIIHTKKYNNKNIITTKHRHKTKKNKLQQNQYKTKKNQSELKYKFLNDGTVAAPDTIDGKLFHNTAPR